MSSLMIAPKKFFRTPEGDLGIEWADSSRNSIPLKKLRLACPCALCVDEHTGERLVNAETIPEDIKLDSLLSVGRYAVGFIWSDGHKTGIYPYPLLKELTKL
jgi:DUF971 family protein